MRARVDAQLLPFRGGAQVAFGVAAQMQPHAAPVSCAVERNVDVLPDRTAAPPPFPVQVVAHVLPQPGRGEGVGGGRLRPPEQVVRHVIVPPAGGEAEGEDAAVIAEVAVHVGRAFPGNHRGQGRRLQARDQPLRHRVIGDAERADAAVAPRLLPGPFDGVVEVARLRRRPGVGAPGRLARAAPVDAHANVSARHPP